MVIVHSFLYVYQRVAIAIAAVQLDLHRNGTMC